MDLALRPSRRLLKALLLRRGYVIARPDAATRDLEPRVRETIERVAPFTLTSPERIAALCAGVEYVVQNGIPGDFVECGVWKGGSMMAVALTLQRLGVRDRELHLFDTFQGMTEPTTKDIDLISGVPAVDQWKSHGCDAGGSWNAASVPEVQAALESTGYDPSLIHYVEGRVEETLPRMAPAKISLLRLDTDWYSSTLHELTELYPRLAVGGVLIVDDYGHYSGARKAVDEYFAARKARILLSRIDYTGRMAVKQVALQEAPNPSAEGPASRPGGDT